MQPFLSALYNIIKIKYIYSSTDICQVIIVEDIFSDANIDLCSYYYF